MFRRVWGVACYIMSLVCLMVLTWKYGLWAALLGYVGCVFMGASMMIMADDDDNDDCEEDDEDEDF